MPADHINRRAGVHPDSGVYEKTGAYPGTLNAETLDHYAQFSNSVAHSIKYRLSRCIDRLKAEGLWADLIQFIPFGTNYNASTGSTLYAVKGTDYTGTTASTTLTTQTFAAGTSFTLPVTAQSPRLEATALQWSHPIISPPATVLTCVLRNTTSADGGVIFLNDGGGLKGQVYGQGFQNIQTLSPSVFHASLPPSCFFATSSVVEDNGEFSVDDDTPFDVEMNNPTTLRDLEDFVFSDDVAYSGGMVWDRVLTPDERVTANTILRATIFRPPVSIIFDGDSIISGSVSPSWIDQTTFDTDLNTFEADNIATGGHTTVDIKAGVTSGIQAAPAEISGSRTWYAVNGGTNDFARAYTADPGDWEVEDIHTRLREIAVLAQAEGRKVAIITPLLVIDTTPGSQGDLYNDSILELRDLLLADVGTYFDGVIDLHAHFVAYDADYQNSAVFSDGIHPYTAQGQTIMHEALEEFVQTVR